MTSEHKQRSPIDEYLDNLPGPTKEKLESIRRLVKEEAPEAQETISYQMPTFVLHGNLVHVAAFKNHIGLYPTSSPMEAFRDQLARYKTSKGAIQFPIDQPLPLDLIREIVRYRIRENEERSEARQKP